jgi:hypothetical protein
METDAMATEQDRKNFIAEFEALKAKYGDEFADLKLVRFTYKKAGIQRDFTPYWCRVDDEGYINCEEERPV